MDSEASTETLDIDINRIMEMIPHRYPFLLIDKVIEANPGQVAEYRAGKDKLIGFFVGQVMKETQGQANPGQVNQILKAKLSG